MLERIPAKIPKIGVFAVAHGTYWSQFPGLKDNMEGYHADLISLIGENKVEIVAEKLVLQTVNGVGTGEQEPVPKQLVIALLKGEKVSETKIHPGIAALSGDDCEDLKPQLFPYIFQKFQCRTVGHRIIPFC